MPFQAGQSGNPNGRPTADRLVNPKSVSGAELREKEFKQQLRRLKPLTNKAIEKLGHMIESEGTSENNRLKAIVFVIKTYDDLINEVYKPVISKSDMEGSNVEDDEEQEPAPIVSLRVVNN